MEVNLAKLLKEERGNTIDIKSKKQKKEHLIRWAHGFPDYYKIGMLNIGYQMAYFMLNDRDDIFCERFFIPELGSKILTLETQSELSDFDIISFSIPFELLFTNTLKALRMGGIELFSKKRERPIIIAGGNAIICNPETMRDFIDVFVVGELEVMAEKVANIISKNIRKPKKEILKKLSKLDGIYIPSQNSHEKIYFQKVKNIEFYTPFIISKNTLWPNYGFIEISRGCPYKCKFCMLRSIYKDVRFRSIERVLEIAQLLSKFTKKIRLVSPAEILHPQIDQILIRLKKLGFHIIVGSQRAELVTKNFLKYIDNTSFALAPETSEKLRSKVGKCTKDKEIFRVIQLINKRKKIEELLLHLIVGFPKEKDRDILELISFIRKCRNILNKDKKLSLSINCFIPKPHTDFQLEKCLDYEKYKKIVEIIKQSVRKLNNIEIKEMDEKTLLVQKIITRGNKNIGKIIYSAFERGDTCTVWQDIFSMYIQKNTSLSKVDAPWKFIVT